MSTPQQSAQQQPAKKGSLITPSRVILIVFLVAALVALGLDLNARSNMNAAYNTAQSMVTGSNSPDDVQKKLNLTPSKQTQEGTGVVEEYIWPGAFYTYHVELRYDNIGDVTWLSQASMKSVSRLPFLRTDQPETGPIDNGGGGGTPAGGDPATADNGDPGAVPDPDEPGDPDDPDGPDDPDEPGDPDDPGPDEPVDPNDGDDG